MVKKLITSIAILLLLIGHVWAEDRRANKSMLVVMTLNVEFMWDGVAPEEGRVDFPWKGSQTESENHMRQVAQIIINSDPDVVNLVEVENEQALKVLNDKFLNGRGYKPYFDKGTDTYTGQDMALLTRIDPEDASIKYDNRKGQRGNLQKSVSKNYVAKFDINNMKIAMIGLHFLSRPLDSSRKNMREAQADAIRSMAVEKKNEGYELIVFGDFNDFDGDQGSRDHIDSMPITNVLNLIKDMNGADASDDLTNAASFVPKQNRFTAFYDANENSEIDRPNELTSIDHILLSHKLGEIVEMVEIPHIHDPRTVTDHYPVVVRLRFDENSSIGGIRIIALLPNPAGNENQNEEITIKNFGGQPVSLVGWKVADPTGKAWSFDNIGTLQPDEQKIIKRTGQPMAMNNSGDTVDLIDPTGTVVQSVTYPRVEEEEIVFPSN